MAKFEVLYKNNTFRSIGKKFQSTMAKVSSTEKFRTQFLCTYQIEMYSRKLLLNIITNLENDRN